MESSAKPNLAILREVTFQNLMQSIQIIDGINLMLGRYANVDQAATTEPYERPRLADGF